MCAASQESNFSLREHYRSLAENEKYTELWEFIQKAISDVIEQEAIRRGVDGVIKDVWFKGEIAGQERVYSDQLLNTVLRARRPEYAAGAKKGSGESAGEEDSKIVLVLPDNRREQMTLDDLKDSSLTSEAKKELEAVPVKELTDES